mgnify:CR=1 FL=1
MKLGDEGYTGVIMVFVANSSNSFHPNEIRYRLYLSVDVHDITFVRPSLRVFELSPFFKISDISL